MRPPTAPPRMTAAALRQRLAAAAVSQCAFARFLGVNPRTVRRWLAGGVRVPRYVAHVAHWNPTELGRAVRGEQPTPVALASLLTLVH